MQTSTTVRARSIGIGFLVGAILGGGVHLWMMDNAAEAAIRRHGPSTMYWGVKPVGETVGALLIFYAYALLACLLLFGAHILITAAERRRRPRPHWEPFAATLAGAVCAAGTNLWLLSGVYHDEVADGEWYSTATVGAALPAMCAFTAVYCGVLLAFLAFLALGALTRHAVATRRAQ